MSGKIFVKEWTERGEIIALSGQMKKSDLDAIYDNLDLSNIKPEFLPNQHTVGGTPAERKESIFSTAQNLWGITPEEWLDCEKGWLQDARKISGSTKIDGKDKISDVVSPEILLRIVATAKLVHEYKYCPSIKDEAHKALDLILSEVCAKGRTRMAMVDDQSVYSILKQNGIMIGTGGGKYLPCPEKSLPYLLLLLHKEVIRPKAYLDE